MNLFKKSFKPMLLKEIEKPFNNKNYIYEIKFDGIRSLIYVSKTSFKIKSRNEKNKGKKRWRYIIGNSQLDYSCVW